MPRPTSKAVVSKAVVPVKLEHPHPTSRVPPAELPKAAAPPPPIPPQAPISPADPVVVPKASPKPASPPPKSNIPSPANARQATPETPVVLAKNVPITPPSGIKTPRPLPAVPPKANAEPNKSIEQPAAVSRSKQVHDDISQKTEAELDNMVANAREQPEFAVYLKWLEKEVGFDEEDARHWGIHDPVEELVDFVLWYEQHVAPADPPAIPLIKAEQKLATPAEVSPTPAPPKRASALRPPPKATPTPQETKSTPTTETQSAKHAAIPGQQPSHTTPAAERNPHDRVRILDQSKVGLLYSMNQVIVSGNPSYPLHQRNPLKHRRFEGL